MLTIDPTRTSDSYDSLDSIAYQAGDRKYRLDLDSDANSVGWIYEIDLGDNGHDGDIATVREVVARVGRELRDQALADTEAAVERCRMREDDMRHQHALYGATDDERDLVAMLTAATDLLDAELKEAR